MKTFVKFEIEINKLKLLLNDLFNLLGSMMKFLIYNVNRIFEVLKSDFFKNFLDVKCLSTL